MPFTHDDDGPASGYKYVRRVLNRYQARPVALNACSGSPRVNLGTYSSPGLAWRAICKWARTGQLPPGVLPTYVRQLRDGTYSAWVCRRGVKVRVGPFDTPEEAAAAIQRALAAVPPRRRREKKAS